MSINTGEPTSPETTKSKHLEEGLRQLEDKYNSLFETIDHGVVYLDQDGKTISANPAAERILGIGLDEMLGRTFIYPGWRTIREDGSDFPGEKHPSMVALRTGKKENNVVMGILKPHEEEHRWIKIQAIPLFRPAEKRPYQVLTTFNDITRYKCAKDARRKSQKLLTRTFDSLRDAIFIIDAETVQIMDCNPASSKLFGYTREEMLGRTTAFIHVDEASLEEFRKHLYAAIEEKGFLYLPEFRMKNKNGEIFFTEHSVMPLVDDNGKRIGWVSVVHDLTARKKAMNKTAYLAYLLENVNDAVVASDESHFISYWNKAAEYVYGWKAREVIGRSLQKVLRPENTRDERSDIRRILKETGQYRGEIIQYRKDGKPIYIETTIIALKNNGSVTGYASVNRDITERKHVEYVLQKERDQAKKYLDIAGVLIVTLNAEGLITLINKKGCEILGYEEKEIIGRNWFDVCLPSAIHDEIMTLFNKLMAGDIETIEYYENPVLTKTGEERIISFHNTIIYDQSSQITGILFSGEDITERKRAEDELRTSEERFRTLVETAASVILWLSPDHKILEFNPEAEQLYNVKRDDVLGKNYLELFLPEEARDSVRADIKKVLSGETTRGFVNPVKTHEGKERTLIWNVNRVFDSGHQPSGIIAVGQDITKHKQAEASLLESEKLYRTIIENSNDMIWTLDRNSNFLFFNKRTEEITGYKLKEMQGKNFTLLIKKSELPFIIDSFKKTLKGTPQQYEVTIKHNDGSILILSVNTAPIYSKGEIVGTVSFGRDITENKQIEEIRLENERLVRVNKTRSEFLSIMSHELRTPLTSITAYSILLKEGTHGKLNNKQEFYVDNIHTSSKHLLELINGILDLAKMEADKLDLVVEDLSLADIINEIFTLMIDKAKKHNIQLKKEFDPSLDHIKADRQKLKQIFFNLLDNAIKFRKEEMGVITISTKKDGDMAKISVSDTGIGIKKEDLPKLFHKFEQLDSGISRKYGGIGLGLVIVKQLVELHGGRITVESKYGVGSTFTFFLPVDGKNTESQ